ncbi:hypothetical protein [Brevundimonas kwangchunensis]|uniref:hypothetical protein n=1 Tax=Brevundimonas kwangchunensis TaxID=322163 RepID=UPI0031DFB00F
MLHTIRRPWKLSVEDCPCDVDFTTWLAGNGVTGRSIFHFGSGEHHHVGLYCARDGAGNSVLAVTATPREHDAYVRIVTKQPEVSKRYAVQFGDIYTTNAALLPVFDIVTLFHLCEFRDERNDAYGALTDAELLELMAGRVAASGHLLVYPGSYAWARAEPIVEAWASSGVFERLDDFRSLRVYRRAG